MNLEIRQASPEDMDRLERIERVAWDDMTTPMPVSPTPVFGKVIPFNDTWVAVLDDEIVGYIALGTRTNLATNRHVGRIRAVAVHPDQRRRGVGRALVRRGVEEAAGRGFGKLMLTVLGSNTRAIALYHSEGFHIEGRLRGEFRLGGHYVDDVFMARWLDEALASELVDSHGKPDPS